MFCFVKYLDNTILKMLCIKTSEICNTDIEICRCRFFGELHDELKAMSAMIPSLKTLAFHYVALKDN